MNFLCLQSISFVLPQKKQKSLIPNPSDPYQEHGEKEVKRKKERKKERKKRNCVYSFMKRIRMLAVARPQHQGPCLSAILDVVQEVESSCLVR